MSKPSQQSELSGTRTALAFQFLIAETEAASMGPSHIPLPWTQANSPPERFTPRRRTAAPAAFTNVLPETFSLGAGPSGGGVVGGSVVGSPPPLQAVPLSAKAVGAAFVPL